jgi:hypothetical protein
MRVKFELDFRPSRGFLMRKKHAILFSFALTSPYTHNSNNPQYNPRLHFLHYVSPSLLQLDTVLAQYNLAHLDTAQDRISAVHAPDVGSDLGI